MIDRITRDGALMFAGGMAFGVQWLFIGLHYLPPWFLWAWLSASLVLGFIYMWAYGSDLAVAIRRRRRQRATVDYPPMEM